MKGFRLRFAFSLLVLAGVVVMWMTLDWVISMHERHMPNPEEIHYHDGIAMTARQHLLTIRFPEERVGPVAFFLLSRTTKSLWTALYILAAIAGWCGSVWLQMLQHKDGETFFPPLFLAALAGVVTFLIVSIVAVFMPALTSIRAELAVIAIAAGLFVATFYQELEGLLKALFAWLRARLGGGSPTSPRKKDDKEKDSGDDKTTKAAALLLVTLAAASSDAGTLYQCVDPKSPVCTASSEAGKEKCPHKCNTWIDTTVGLAWLASMQASDPRAVSANWFLDRATKQLYGASLFGDAPPMMSTVYKTPAGFGLKTVKKDDVEPGTIVLLPNLTAVVTSTASDPLDATVVYPSASKHGKPNEEKLRDLIGSGAPKFVIPAGVMNEATAPPK